MRQVQELFEEIKAEGGYGMEYGYAGLINCFRHMPAVSPGAGQRVGLPGNAALWRSACLGSQRGAALAWAQLSHYD